MSTKEISTTTSHAPAVLSGEKLESRVKGMLAEYLADAPRQVEADGLNAMLDRILSSETVEQLAGVFASMDNTKDAMAFGEFLIDGFTIRDSSYTDTPGSLGIYATIYGRKMNGENVQFNSGATTVVATLLIANAREWFPLKARVASKDLDGGNTAYNLLLV